MVPCGPFVRTDRTSGGAGSVYADSAAACTQVCSLGVRRLTRSQSLRLPRTMPAGAALTVMGRVSARKPDAHAEVTGRDARADASAGHSRECSRGSRLPSQTRRVRGLDPCCALPWSGLYEASAAACIFRNGSLPRPQRIRARTVATAPNMRTPRSQDGVPSRAFDQLERTRRHLRSDVYLVNMRAGDQVQSERRDEIETSEREGDVLLELRHFGLFWHTSAYGREPYARRSHRGRRRRLR